MEEAGAGGGTLVAFESPKRLPGTLRALAQRWPERRLAVCRELTKLHEEVLRATAAELAQQVTDPVRGEVVLVLEAVASRESAREQGGALGVGTGAAEGSPGQIQEALEALLDQGWGARRAADFVAALTGRAKRPVYSLALELKRDRGGQPPQD